MTFHIKSRVLTVTALLTIIFSLSVHGQDTLPLWYYGGFASYNYNIHSADFSQLPGIANCCPHFTYAYGSGFAIGGLFDYPLKPAIWLGARLDYSSIGADFKEQELIGNTEVSGAVPAYADHDLNSHLGTLGIEPYVNFKYFKGLYTYIGFRFAYIIKGTFDQQEQITSPSNIVFLSTGSRTRNVQNGLDIPEINKFQLFGVLGFGYELPIDKNTYIVPEIRYHIPFINVSSVPWKAGTFQVGAAIKLPVFKPKEIQIIRDTLMVRDTSVIAQVAPPKNNIRLIDSRTDTQVESFGNIIRERHIFTEHYEKIIPKDTKISASVDIAGIAKDGSRQDNPSIIIEENEVVESFPILPYLYYPEASSDLKSSSQKLLTKQETGQFKENSLPKNTMGIYSDLLNIIAYRMKKNPDSKINVLGCNNNKGEEENNLSLSKARAEAIKNYLTDTWGIAASRISVTSQNLPGNPSNNEYADGQAENSRAEITSDDPGLLKPVVLSEIEKVSNPPVIEINPKLETDTRIKDWKITVTQGSKQLRSYEGAGDAGKLAWNIIEEPIPALETPVDIKLTATDIAGKVSEETKSITIKQLTIRKKRYELKDDKIIERFSLILFDFDKTDITPRQKAILNEIKTHIKPNSLVTIAGYTDRTGDADYNKVLALRRSQEAQKLLQVDNSHLKIDAAGNSRLLYDNDLPQGRSYCRTVQVIIETPVK